VDNNKRIRRKVSEKLLAKALSVHFSVHFFWNMRHILLSQNTIFVFGTTTYSFPACNNAKPFQRLVGGFKPHESPRPVTCPFILYKSYCCIHRKFSRVTDITFLISEFLYLNEILMTPRNNNVSFVHNGLKSFIYKAQLFQKNV